MIIDLACSKPKNLLSDAEIRKMRYCRSYLQLYRLSNMCTVDGSYILDTVLKGRRSIIQGASRNGEILQERLDKIA